jgi:hypothetical protein
MLFDRAVIHAGPLVGLSMAGRRDLTQGRSVTPA